MSIVSPLEVRALADRILVDAVGISTAHTEWYVQHMLYTPDNQKEKAFEELKKAVEKAQLDIDRLVTIIGVEQTTLDKERSE